MTTTHFNSLHREMATVRRSGWWVPSIAVVVLMAFVAAATWGTLRSNSRQSDLAIQARTDAVAVSIDDRLAAYEEVLYGVRNGFTVEADLDRALYHDLVTAARADDRMPGVQVIGAAHLVAADDIAERNAAVNAAVEEAGLAYPDFEVYPDTDREFALPIDYIEPQAGNERAFGLDFFSEPNRRAAALQTRDTGETAMTAPITLVQETGTQRAVLVMLALYRPGASTATIEDRRDAFEGVVYAAFRMGDLVRGALAEDDQAAITLVDVASSEVLYDDGEAEEVAQRDELDVRIAQFEVAGRDWRVVLDADVQVLSTVQRAFPYLTALAGLIVAGLMGALIVSMRSSRSRAVELAEEMSVELEALTESASEGIISVDEQGRIVAWNAGATHIFGAAAREMLGSEASDLVPACDRDGFRAAFHDALEGANPDAISRHYTITACREGGTEFPADVSLSRWTARDRSYLTGFVRDATKRIEAEEQLTDTTNMLLGVLGAATELSIIATDLDGAITVFNAGAEQMLGYDASEVLGGAVATHFHDPSEVAQRADELGVEPGFEVFIATARDGRSETRTWTYIRSDGSRLPVELTVAPRLGDNGQVIGFIGVGVDITQRLAARQQQQTLLDHERDVVAKLTELDRVKNEFVSTTSHELRTPLTSIIGYAELLAEDTTIARIGPQASMIETIEKNAQRLLSLVEDLLTHSKIESGALDMVRAPCDVARLIDSSREAILPSAAQRDIAVTTELSSLPAINADGALLERVMLNLLSNAVKFSRRGGTVEVRAWENQSDGGVTIEVRDHGIGIPSDEMEFLFSRFFRSRTAGRHAVQGSGLGLSIVANIVHRHGGKVNADSIEDVGTTITVDLPPGVPDSPEDAQRVTQEEVVV